ncbi:MAG: LysR family transcriptional regulator [Gammaproteobacteria bacterium]|nr:LysR family transcriptional regulator [Gammaproteobacteria bacterium]
MDKVQAMTTFVAIVRQGSLTAAGEVLDKSLPTVVRLLATLEASLGVRLLNRTTRRLALTEEGRHYYERCQKILADIEQAELELSAEHSEPSGSLRVTSSMMFGQMHVSPVVAQFLGRYRQMQINLIMLDRIVNLIEEGVDVAVRIGHLADSSLIAIPVGEIRRVVCASPEFLKSSATVTRPQDLAKQSCVRFTGITPAPTWQFQDNHRSLNVHIESHYACNHAVPTIDACCAGLGYGMFLSYMVEPQLKSGALKLVLEDFEAPAMPVHLVYQQTKFVSTRVRVFVDWMKNALRQELGYQWAAHFND